jgi:hypothetical protein
MFLDSLRRFGAIAVFAILSVGGATAQTFSGTTLIDFDAAGYANYTLSFQAVVTVGENGLATAYAGYGDFAEMSYGSHGEAGVGIVLENIQKVGGQWVAATATVSVYDAETQEYETSVFYSVALDAAGEVFGEAEFEDDSVIAVRGTLTGF